jgi:hypothetical protein
MFLPLSLTTCSLDYCSSSECGLIITSTNSIHGKSQDKLFQGRGPRILVGLLPTKGICHWGGNILGVLQVWNPFALLISLFACHAPRVLLTGDSGWRFASYWIYLEFDVRIIVLLHGGVYGLLPLLHVGKSHFNCKQSFWGLLLPGLWLAVTYHIRRKGSEWYWVFVCRNEKLPRAKGRFDR